MRSWYERLDRVAREVIGPVLGAARRLDRSCSTIDHQLRSMRSKLGVSSTAKLVRELSRRLGEGGRCASLSVIT
jgi:hypothetical protein